MNKDERHDHLVMWLRGRRDTYRQAADALIALHHRDDIEKIRLDIAVAKRREIDEILAYLDSLASL